MECWVNSRGLPQEKYTVWSFSARNRKFEKLPLERRHVTSETF